jgi:hypothetical protein
VDPEAPSDVPPFATRDEATRKIEVLFAPPIEEWDLTMPSVTWSPDEELLTRFGALPRTMHFGLMEVDLRAGEVRFWDQDHRDGGDDLLLTAELPESWIEGIRALETKSTMDQGPD